MTAILLVHVEDSVSGGAGTGEGVEDDAVRVGGDFENAFNQTNWLGIIKNCFPQDGC